MLKDTPLSPMAHAWPLAILVLPSLMGVSSCERVEVGDACLVDGDLYKPGDAVPSGDSCNTCTCDESGEVACTEVDCPQEDADACGGLAGVACDKGEYCRYAPDAQCGAADQTGVCAPTPEACDTIFDPVCGCDDETYDNDCVAAAAGVSVASQGQCMTGAGGTDTCGGLAGLACDKGEYCRYAPDAQCGAADQTGVCTPIPEACDTIFDPVCGCDDRTYDNDCTAAASGVSVAAAGACP